MILYGAAMSSKAFVELAFGLPNVLFFAFFTANKVNSVSRFTI